YFILLFFFISPTSHTLHTLSLHDALPICFTHHDSLTHIQTNILMVSDTVKCSLMGTIKTIGQLYRPAVLGCEFSPPRTAGLYSRSEEHTSELQSLAYLVCRLLLEKKKKNT